MRTLKTTNQIENQICEAIELIVNKAVASAGYDRTIRASIVSCIDQSIGKYKIKYQDNIFYAYSENVDTKYSKGTEVYVLVHNNDLNMNKTILGSVKKLGTDYINTVSTENKYEKIGTNLITETNDFELCSFIQEDKKDINANLVFLKEDEIKEYLSKSSHIIIEADIKTVLPQSQRYKGNYGITFDLDFYASEAEKSASSPEIVTKTYKLDINNITGEPYALNSFTKQFAVFKINTETFKGIGNVSIFEYGFPEQKEDQPSDIFIQNISLYGATEIAEQDLLSCYLSIVTIEGTYFDEQNLATDEKSMQAQVIAKGSAIDESSQQVKYYWFKENAKTTSVDLTKFNKYGGIGWECLNDYNVIQSDEEGTPVAIEWASATNKYTLRKEEILTTEIKYKCVALYGETILSKEVTFKNMDAPYRLSIVSDGGTSFYEGVGEPTLTCLVNENENIIDYVYYWVTLDNNNLLADVQSNNNKVENINVKAIMDFVTYKCAVYLATDNSYLGSTSITLTNGDMLEENEYTFILNNGIQVFKYDEDGIAPTSEIMDNPQVILPLSFTTYDSAGALIPSEEVCANGIVKWTVPFEDSSLILMPDGYSDGIVTEEGFVFKGYPELNYTISKRYNSRKTDNTIKLSIEYNGYIFNTETSLSFLKEGDPGTNGTSYFCRIVPNIIKGESVPYPLINYNIETGNYELNYNRPIGQENKWFKVQLWENDSMIFEDISNSIATTAKPYTIEWSIPKNQYSSETGDVSDLAVESSTGSWGFTKNSNNIVVNIAKCKVEYNQQTFYATLPVLTALNSNASFTIIPKKNTGFSFVRYASDGTNPQYNGTNTFAVEVFENSENITQQEGLTYEWLTKGSIYDLYTSSWSQQLNLTIPSYSNQDINNWERVVRPEEPYTGECLSNSIECKIMNEEGVILTTLRIPIHMYLNRYGLAALNDWDGNHIDVNENGGYILAPQIGAGAKDENNNFTGIVMGEVRESGKSDTDIGLLGYAQGIRSIFLDAETGKAEFGTASKIIIDPTDGTAQLYSGNYSTSNKAGMLIDLSEPSIKFGSGDFLVDSSGYMTAKGGGSIAGWEISDDTLTGNSVGIKSKGSSNSEIAFWAGSNTSSKAKFRVDFAGNLNATDAVIKGEIQADSGSIGDWTINNGYLEGENVILNCNASKNKNAIKVGDNFSVTTGGKMTAASGVIGGWYVENNQIYSLYDDKKLTILDGTSGLIETEYISIFDSTETASNLGQIGLMYGSDGVSTTYHIGIKSATGKGIILDADTNMSLRADGGIYLTTGSKGLILNGVKIDGIARFG